MTDAAPRFPRSTFAWPALLATVLLLILLLGGYSLLESHRLQQSLGRELEGRARALVGVLEAASVNAIASSTLLEEAVAQRLLDNARFIDFLAARGPWAQELIRRVQQENRLAKVELLDPRGHPVQFPPSPEGGPGFGGAGRGPRGMMGMGMPGPPAPPSGGAEASSAPPAVPPPGMPFMWGRRWGGPRGDPASLFPALPKDAPIRRFWEGSAFGVAVPAQSFPGIVAVHADAAYLLNFRKETGLQRLIEDLGRQAGVAGVALLDRNLAVLAASDPAAVGQPAPDPFLEAAAASGAVRGRHLPLPDGREVYQVVSPFSLDRERAGLLRLELDTAGMAQAVAQTHRSVLFYSVGLLLVGVAGTLAIFWIQARHTAERGALEAAVAREQRLSAMGNLAAGVAHEIRNPLNAIAIGLQRLGMEFAPSQEERREEHARFVRILRDQVGRLNTLIEQFLALARPLTLHLAEEPVASLLGELAALLQPQATAQGVRIELEAPEGLRARMDRGQLHQALLNVLLNAIQAMPEGGTLRIRAERAPAGRRGGGLSIRVQDTGPGIGPAELERIFEPYFTTKEGGTGLGLALARKVVQEHGGEIGAESPAGGGALFTIRLPLAGAEDVTRKRET